ncbi:hypothetical protein BH10ACT2_BH10ACT2_20980 [soil metagenome]
MIQVVAPRSVLTTRRAIPRLTRFVSHPVCLAVIAGALPVLAAASVPDSTYRLLWRTPKYVVSSDVRVGLALAATFAFGAVVGIRSRWRGLPESLNTPRAAQRAGRASQLLLQIGIAAYLIWFVIGVMRGLAPGEALSALSGSRGGISLLKDRYLRPIAGVTTFIQLTPPGAALALYSRRIQGHWSPQLRRLFVAALLCTIVRAFLYAERLALLEVMVPLLLIYSATAAESKSSPNLGRRTLLRQAVGAVAVSTIYPIQEYYRSWLPYYRGTYDGSFSSYIWARLAGYYITAVNNSSVTIHLVDPSPGRVILRSAYEFPIVGSMLFPSGDRTSMSSVLGTYANPEFNNPGGLLALYADIGKFAFVPVFVTGLLIGHVYGRVVTGGGPIIVVYGTLIIAMLEMSRIPYLALPRGLIPIVSAVVAFRWIAADRRPIQ